MFSEWDNHETADDLLREALNEALAEVREGGESWARLREEVLRMAIFQSLDRRLPGHVRRERRLTVDAFRGVGPSDLLVDRNPGGRVGWLAETKWSYGDLPKLFECVWDAVKLCIQVREHQVARAWVIAGASDAAWQRTEVRELFTGGEADTVALWDTPLDPPRGPNYGATVGDDLVIGGNGNRPTSVPKTIQVEPVCAVSLTAGEPWTVRAIAVSPGEDWIDEFAPPPKFPSPMTQKWMLANVPKLDDATFGELLAYLRVKRWTDRELDERVLPLRRQELATGEDWRRQFPDAKRVVALEGGAVYTAERDGAWWIIRDETPILDMLDGSDAADMRERAVAIEQFGDRASWQAAVDSALSRAAPPKTPALDSPRHRIRNEDLTERDLPAPYASWEQISRFAGSFSGYAEHGGPDALAQFAREVRSRYGGTGELPNDIADLRSALFYEQRSDHFSHSADEALPYIHALVEALRAALRARR